MHNFLSNNFLSFELTVLHTLDPCFAVEEYLTSGVTGEPLECYIFCGPIYYQVSTGGAQRYLVQTPVEATDNLKPLFYRFSAVFTHKAALILASLLRPGLNYIMHRCYIVIPSGKLLRDYAAGRYNPSVSKYCRPS